MQSQRYSNLVRVGINGPTVNGLRKIWRQPPRPPDATDRRKSGSIVLGAPRIVHVICITPDGSTQSVNFLSYLKDLALQKHAEREPSSAHSI
jgi:hypothetical protein